MRLFIAINLPARVRRSIVDATASMRAAAPGVGWVSGERLHLTLEFLGERPDHPVASLEAALRREAVRHAELTLELRGLGAFPNLRSSSVDIVESRLLPEGARYAAVAAIPLGGR